MSSKITIIQSSCIPLNRNNVDTDQIIPARFLKGTGKAGLGEKAFYDWRYLEDGSPNLDFPLNNPRYSGSILVAAHNFGCGSSREHAPWALRDYGFQAVIAISFADIFRNNSLKNQLLPIPLPESVVLKLLSDIEQDPSLQVTIDLPNQTVKIPGQPDQHFVVDPYRKQCLMEGLDDIGYTLSHLADIEAYEAKHA
ncbi:MAG TPA: 3-isopropylmalate dehydratase small subunit [Oculatellaceae cyanobacterium]|jgi:3-isopropylmalate/(R)-2-methylmalate dehydratase small subunit